MSAIAAFFNPVFTLADQRIKVICPPPCEHVFYTSPYTNSDGRYITGSCPQCGNQKGLIIEVRP